MVLLVYVSYINYTVYLWFAKINTNSQNIDYLLMYLFIAHIFV